MNINEIITNPACLNETLNRTIDEKDQMYTGSDLRYFGCGADAIRKICSIINNIGIDHPENILDFACGYGRVARYLSSAFPSSELTVCDVMADAINFCAKEFSAVPQLSNASLSSLELEKKFSLIWSGSLMTHLNEEKAIQLLQLFEQHLDVNGIAVFTIHGRYVAHKWKTDKKIMQLKDTDGKKLSDQFNDNNYAYADYPHMKGYGMSLTPVYWIIDQLTHLANFRVISVIERGWDNHQDIIALQKIPINNPWNDCNPHV